MQGGRYDTPHGHSPLTPRLLALCTGDPRNNFDWPALRKRREVMPYHLEALETSWDEIDPKYKFLLKALLNGGGYYGLSVGLFMLTLLLIPFRADEDWAGYAIG